MTNKLHQFRPLAAAALVCLLSMSVPAFAGQASSSSTPTNLVITQGGTYSGNWSSNDPSTPALTIATDEPVTIQNSTVIGRGDLIEIYGNNNAQVTIQNVTGVALDPGVSGSQRGAFIHASKMSTLQVTHCSMYGVSFGVQLVYSAMQSLTLSQNFAAALEDRASDGQGGLLSSRPNLGHFIQLVLVSAFSADISWNKVVNVIGASSTEDVISIYKSQGTAQSPIHVHDNYLEGYSSTTTSSYTGTGVIADGDGGQPDTAYALFENNEMVHTAGSGVEIATGHDINVQGNRVVSCGEDASGNWFAMPFINGIIVWNYYGSSTFYNNTVAGTQGGMLRPSSTNTPQVADIWANTANLDSSDNISNNSFTDPCLVNGQVNLSAEDAERTFWANKIASAGVRPGANYQ